MAPQIKNPKFYYSESSTGTLFYLIGEGPRALPVVNDRAPKELAACTTPENRDPFEC